LYLLPSPYWQDVKVRFDTATVNGPTPTSALTGDFISEGLQSSVPPDPGTIAIPSTT
jgi:hypothetical protein